MTLVGVISSLENKSENEFLPFQFIARHINTVLRVLRLRLGIDVDAAIFISHFLPNMDVGTQCGPQCHLDQAGLAP